MIYSCCSQWFSCHCSYEYTYLPQSRACPHKIKSCLLCIYQALPLLSEESLGTRLLSQYTTDGSGEVCALSNDELNLLNFLQYCYNLWSLKPCLYQCHRASEFRMLKTTSSCSYTCVTTSQFQLLYTKCHTTFVL